MVHAVGIVVAVVVMAACSAPGGASDRWVQRDDFQNAFDEAGVEGVFLVFESGSQRALTNDAVRARQAFIPASTFKIFNSLVALEVGAVADVGTTLPWDGVDRGWSQWNRDQDLRSALEFSAVWFYQELARRIGPERMQHFVDAAGYGNRDISGGIDLFWLEGGLRISALEQIGFLRRLHADDLPFSRRSMTAVKDILIRERTAAYTLRAKTGWGSRFTPQVGWYVGYVERDDAVLFFALNLDIRENQDADARIAIARRLLGELGAFDPA